jgi:hypothetical protein
VYGSARTSRRWYRDCVIDLEDIGVTARDFEALLYVIADVVYVTVVSLAKAFLNSWLTEHSTTLNPRPTWSLRSFEHPQLFSSLIIAIGRRILSQRCGTCH